MAASQGPNKRTMIVLCAVLGVLAVVAVVRFAGMSGGGGDDGTSSASPSPSVVVPATASTTTTTAPGEPTVPSGEFDALVGRDPFEPVVQLESSATSAGDSTASTAAAGAPDPGGSSTPPATTAAPSPSGDATIVLVDVVAATDGSTQARVTVGGTEYTVSAGQTFAGSYKVVSISGTCGQFLYGDAPFSLCKGEQASPGATVGKG
jgi:type IV pilus biogenesis protein PilP